MLTADLYIIIALVISFMRHFISDVLLCSNVFFAFMTAEPSLGA